MSTWNVTNDARCDATPTGAITARGQLGALAAGATVERCGACSALQRVMGRGPAASMVQLLWTDWVRPTIRQFVFQVFGSTSTGATSKPYRHITTLWFGVSPLLLSLACGPDLGGPPTIRSGALADGYHVIQLEPCEDSGCAISIRNLHNDLSTRVIRRSQMAVINSQWAVVITYNRGQGAATTPLSVAKLSGGLGSGMKAVIVGMPFVAIFGSSFIYVYPDQSVESEVIVVHTVQNGATILAVDIEQTYNRRSLVVLSTTRCEFPFGSALTSLIVMRNWDFCSPRYGSRTFIAKTEKWSWNGAVHRVFHIEEATGASRHLKCHSETVEGLFRISDSVFCVSFCYNNQDGSFEIFHRDNVAQPLQLPWMSKSSKSHADTNTFQLTAEYGYIFQLNTSRIEVIEPISGFTVLTINFPGITLAHITTPFSFFLPPELSCS